MRRSVVTVVGDSHALVFDELRARRLLPGVWLDVVSVGGATALGLANPNSTTNAVAIFSDVLRRTPASRPTIFMLGEVDCGFLIWYRSTTRGSTVDDEFQQSLERYTAFLDEARDAGRRSIIVLSVAPPTVPDYSVWVGLENARRDVTASIEARTELTRAYNRELGLWAVANSAEFIDLDTDLIDPSTGLLDERFRNPDPYDHHLAPIPFAALLAERLGSLRPAGR